LEQDGVPAAVMVVIVEGVRAGPAVEAIGVRAEAALERVVARAADSFRWSSRSCCDTCA